MQRNNRPSIKHIDIIINIINYYISENLALLKQNPTILLHLKAIVAPLYFGINPSVDTERFFLLLEEHQMELPLSKDLDVTGKPAEVQAALALIKQYLGKIKEGKEFSDKFYFELYDAVDRALLSFEQSFPSASAAAPLPSNESPQQVSSMADSFLPVELIYLIYKKDPVALSMLTLTSGEIHYSWHHERSLFDLEPSTLNESKEKKRIYKRAKLLAHWIEHPELIAENAALLDHLEKFVAQKKYGIADEVLLYTCLASVAVHKKEKDKVIKYLNHLISLQEKSYSAGLQHNYKYVTTHSSSFDRLQIVLFLCILFLGEKMQSSSLRNVCLSNIKHLTQGGIKEGDLIDPLVTMEESSIFHYSSGFDLSFLDVTPGLLASILHIEQENKRNNNLKEGILDLGLKKTLYLFSKKIITADDFRVRVNKIFNVYFFDNNKKFYISLEEWKRFILTSSDTYGEAKLLLDSIRQELLRIKQGDNQVKFKYPANALVFMLSLLSAWSEINPSNIKSQVEDFHLILDCFSKLKKNQYSDILIHFLIESPRVFFSLPIYANVAEILHLSHVGMINVFLQAINTAIKKYSKNDLMPLIPLISEICKLSSFLRQDQLALLCENISSLVNESKLWNLQDVSHLSKVAPVYYKYVTPVLFAILSNNFNAETFQSLLPILDTMLREGRSIKYYDLDSIDFLHKAAFLSSDIKGVCVSRLKDIINSEKALFEENKLELNRKICLARAILYVIELTPSEEKQYIDLLDKMVPWSVLINPQTAKDDNLTADFFIQNLMMALKESESIVKEISFDKIIRALPFAEQLNFIRELSSLSTAFVSSNIKIFFEIEILNSIGFIFSRNKLNDEDKKWLIGEFITILRHLPFEEGLSYSFLIGLNEILKYNPSLLMEPGMVRYLSSFHPAEYVLSQEYIDFYSKFSSSNFFPIITHAMPTKMVDPRYLEQSIPSLPYFSANYDQSASAAASVPDQARVRHASGIQENFANNLFKMFVSNPTFANLFSSAKKLNLTLHQFQKMTAEYPVECIQFFLSKENDANHLIELLECMAQWPEQTQRLLPFSYHRCVDKVIESLFQKRKQDLFLSSGLLEKSSFIRASFTRYIDHTLSASFVDINLSDLRDLIARLKLPISAESRGKIGMPPRPQ